MFELLHACIPTRHNTGCPASLEPVVDPQPLGKDALELDELLDLDPLVGHVCLRDVSRAADEDRLGRVAVVARRAAGTAESVRASVRGGTEEQEEKARRRGREQGQEAEQATAATASRS